MKIGVIGFVFSCTFFASPGFSMTEYKIILDAGSSGTRLHIFQYDRSKVIPGIHKVFSKNIKPGLASFADNPKGASNYIKPLLDDASTFLKEQKISLQESSIDLMATAGMRQISEDKQDGIYQDLRSFISHTYSFQMGEIKTISGEMEGLYGWLDVNYLLKNFQHHTPTVGSIDMGGASTQIAYETKNLSEKNLISLDIDQQHYDVVSKSFNGFGQDLSLASMMQDKDSNACFPAHYNYQDKQMGLFNREACSAIYQDRLNQQKISEHIEFAPLQRFIAFSGIYYTFNFFDMDKEPSFLGLESKIDAVCNKDWFELQKDYPNVSDKYKASNCANAVYEDELLFHTYKMEPGQLQVTNTILNQDIDWALGALLYKLVTSPIP